MCIRDSFYNAICLSFALATWYPASHAAKNMIDDENFARTWYIFWILPLTFIGLNLFMVPRYRNTLYTGRILHGYIVISLVLLAILVLFYAMFLLMADSLNRNARLQQENHFLSLQQARYDNLRAAIEEARQARHDRSLIHSWTSRWRSEASCDRETGAAAAKEKERVALKFERNRTENHPKYRAPEAGEKARLSVSEVSAADNCLPEDKRGTFPEGSR